MSMGGTGHLRPTWSCTTRNTTSWTYHKPRRSPTFPLGQADLGGLAWIRKPLGAGLEWTLRRIPPRMNRLSLQRLKYTLRVACHQSPVAHRLLSISYRLYHFLIAFSPVTLGLNNQRHIYGSSRVGLLLALHPRLHICII